MSSFHAPRLDVLFGLRVFISHLYARALLYNESSIETVLIINNTN